jgi:hypothetical protein
MLFSPGWSRKAPHMRIEVSVHFAADARSYQGQVIARRIAPQDERVEAITLTLSQRRADASAAVDDAEDFAAALRREPEKLRALFGDGLK